MKKKITLHSPFAICSLPDTTFADKIILLLVYSFRKKGMVLFDGTIAEYCQCSRRHIVERISALNSMGYLKIEKAKSKYRRIYPSEKMLNLLSTLLLSKKESTEHSTSKRGNYTSQYSLRLSNNKTLTEENTFGDDKTSSKGSTKHPQEKTFEIFWQAYPKKVARKEALKSWQKLKPDQKLFDVIMLALEKHKQQESWNKENGRFIPKPSTWLNAERWTDEIANPQAEPDYSAALDKYTRDVSEEEADELMRAIQQDDS